DLAEEVIVLDGADAAQQGQFVQDARLERHQLTDARAGQPGGDGPEWAAELIRGVGLEVVGVDMTRPAAQHDVDQGLRPGGAAGVGPVPQQVGQGEPAEPQGADPEEFAVTDAVAVARTAAPDADHRRYSGRSVAGSIRTRQGGRSWKPTRARPAVQAGVVKARRKPPPRR